MDCTKRRCWDIDTEGRQVTAADNEYIAVQLEEQNQWNIYKLPEYGMWFDKELDIFMRMVTGL